MEKAEKEIGAYLIVLFFFEMHTAQYSARTLHFARGVITLLKGPIVKDIIASIPVQAVLKAPPLRWWQRCFYVIYDIVFIFYECECLCSVLPPSAYESMIMAAVKAAFAATVIFRVRSIVEMVWKCCESAVSNAHRFPRKFIILICCFMQKLFRPKSDCKWWREVISTPSVPCCSQRFWSTQPCFQHSPRRFSCPWICQHH